MPGFPSHVRHCLRSPLFPHPNQNTEVISTEKLGARQSKPRTHQRAVDPTKCYIKTIRKTSYMPLGTFDLQDPQLAHGCPQSSVHLTHPNPNPHPHDWLLMSAPADYNCEHHSRGNKWEALSTWPHLAGLREDIQS